MNEKCRTEITRYRVPGSDLVVYNVVLIGVCTKCDKNPFANWNGEHTEHDTWSWNETYGTLGELRAFIDGVKIAALIFKYEIGHIQVPDDPDVDDTALLGLVRFGLVRDSLDDEFGGEDDDDFDNGSDDGFSRLLKHANDRLSIAVRRVEVRTDPCITVYEIRLRANADVHTVFYPNELLLNAYLRGIKAITFSNGLWLDFPDFYHDGPNFKEYEDDLEFYDEP